jgi:MraZ protein
VFLGTHTHNLDTKGRLAIPAKFRDELGSESVLTRGADQCLAIYPPVAWRSLCAKIETLPLSDHDARMYRRFLFADALTLEPDGQGRVLLPVELRRFAGIDRSVVVVGMDSVIEVWATEAWDAIHQRLDAQADEIINRLGSLI